MNINIFIKFDFLSRAWLYERHDDLFRGTALSLSFSLRGQCHSKVGHEKEKRVSQNLGFLRFTRCNSSAARHSKNRTYLPRLSNSLLALSPRVRYVNYKLRIFIYMLLLSAANFSAFYDPLDPINDTTLEIVYRLSVYRCRY